MSKPFEAAIEFLQQQLDDVESEEKWCREDGFIGQADAYVPWIRDCRAAIRLLKAAGKVDKKKASIESCGEQKEPEKGVLPDDDPGDIAFHDDIDMAYYDETQMNKKILDMLETAEPEKPAPAIVPLCITPEEAVVIKAKVNGFLNKPAPPKSIKVTRAWVEELVEVARWGDKGGACARARGRLEAEGIAIEDEPGEKEGGGE